MGQHFGRESNQFVLPTLLHLWHQWFYFYGAFLMIDIEWIFNHIMDPLLTPTEFYSEHIQRFLLLTITGSPASWPYQICYSLAVVGFIWPLATSWDIHQKIWRACPGVLAASLLLHRGTVGMWCPHGTFQNSILWALLFCVGIHSLAWTSARFQAIPGLLPCSSTSL